MRQLNDNKTSLQAKCISRLPLKHTPRRFTLTVLLDDQVEGPFA
ncbi:MAG: hypothetical protein CFH06_00929 [Alphaproteobacteria bacterium MarineAlpha3_Bin5]|nr:MAG: hypothetical protein CFH06_00929 [Alphaproteobacteria bacterium MarineAlpha3_Bin5]